jgi:hypothetical protein
MVPARCADEQVGNWCPFVDRQVSRANLFTFVACTGLCAIRCKLMIMRDP